MMDWNAPRAIFGLNAVYLAANLAMEIQGDMVSEAITKDDRSPVTVADFAAQAVVGYLLDRSFPGELLVGEEQSDVLRSPDERDTLEKITGYVSRVMPGATTEQVCDYIDRGGDSPGSVYWTLDPIDGTKGFLRGDQYATALAFVKDGEVELGVLGCPNLNPDLKGKSQRGGSLLIASRGEGSWITRLENYDKLDQFERLSVSQRSDPAESRLLRSFELGHTNSDQVDAIQREMGVNANPIRMDSQVKYALLAAGEGEIYLRLLSPNRLDYKEKIWDQAAGSIIVEEAGGVVTDLDGERLDFSQGRTLKINRGICASNGIIHDRILEAIRKVRA
jgi:3'(2'), 5'-bisphosphate nucleotidase